MAQPRTVALTKPHENENVIKQTLLYGSRERKTKAFVTEGILAAHDMAENEFKGFLMGIPLSNFSDDKASTVYSYRSDDDLQDQKLFFQPINKNEVDILPEFANLRTKNALNLQSILEWYGSWKNWQRKILLAGIIKRFSKRQLKTLAIAMEPMFHRDFVSVLKQAYKLPKNSQPDKDRATSSKGIKTKKGIFPDKNSIQTETKKSEIKVIYQSLQTSQMDSTNILEEENNKSEQSSQSTSGSSNSRNISCKVESRIEESPSKSQEPSEDEQSITATTDVEMLMSYGLDNVSADGTQSFTDDKDSSTVNIASDKAAMKAVKKFKVLPKLLQQKIKSSAKPGFKRKKKKKKLFIPNEVLYRISSASSSQSSASDNICRNPKNLVQYPVRISQTEIGNTDFFKESKAGLGKLFTTRSKLGSAGQKKLDPQRNKVPVPVIEQTCKQEKFWGTSADTVEVSSKELEEIFQRQLDQIWTFSQDWPPHQFIRLLQTLIEKSDNNIIMFIAKCMRDQSKEAGPLNNLTEMIKDKLLLKIFELLTPFDAFYCSLVCTRWYAVLQNDAFWRKKCNVVGTKYGIPKLPQLLQESAGHNETLDWQRACIEIYEYLLLNVTPVDVDSSSDEDSSDSDEDGEMEKNILYKSYVPYWKINPNLFKSRTRKQDAPELIIKESSESVIKSTEPKEVKKKAGFLEMWKNITEDIKDTLMEKDAEASHTCFDVDLFADMQPWSDVEVMTQIGQRFAVDFHIGNKQQEDSSVWLVDHDLYPITKVQVFKGHQGAVYCVHVQGKRIFSGSIDREVRIWDLEGRCQNKLVDDIKGGINSIYTECDEKSNTVITASWDMTICIWDSVSCKLVKKLTGHTGSVTQIVVDNKHIISSSHDGTVRVWDRNNYKCITTIKCHRGEVQCVASNKGIVVSGGVDKNVYASNHLTGGLLKTFIGHTAPVTAVKVQHNLLASGDMEGVLIFWSFDLIQSSNIEEKLQAHESQINAILFQNKHFFTVSNDALVKEWDLLTMSCLRVLQGHTDGVTDIKVRRNFIATSSRDNDVRIWWFGRNDQDTKRHSGLTKKLGK